MFLSLLVLAAFAASISSLLVAVAALLLQRRAVREQGHLAARALAQGEEGLQISRVIKAQTLASTESASTSVDTLTQLRVQELEGAKTQTGLLRELLASHQAVLAALQERAR
jgi:hypothetical protein